MTRGVVYAEPDAAPAVEELTVDPPGPREVLVRVEACGLCHSDLHIVETKGWGMRFPILLGHEGAGVVEEVGSEVTSVAPGDRVVVAWRAPVRRVPAVPARRSAPLLVAAAREAAAAPGVRRRAADAGAALRHVRRPGGRARGLRGEGARGAAGRAGSLLACGFSTGAGAALWATPVQQGSSVAVIGCGGVGLAVVQGAMLRRRGADHRRRRRAGEARARARPRRDRRRRRVRGDPVEAVRELTGGRGVEFAFSADRRHRAGSCRPCGCAPTRARRRSSACRCPARS